MRQVTIAVVALLALATQAACNKPKGSCDRRAAAAKTCTELLASTLKDKAKHECPEDSVSHEKGTWSDGACDRTNAIAGCQNSLGRTWYYPGSVASKVEQVATLCDAPGDKLVDVKGKALTGIAKEPISKDRADTDVAALVAPLKSKIEPRIAAVEGIHVTSAAAPKGTITTAKPLEAATSAVVWDDDLVYLTGTEGLDRAYKMPDSQRLRSCAVALRKQQRFFNPSDADLQKTLTWCSGLEHLVVVRTTKDESPSSYSGDAFKGGAVEGYVYVFDLPSGASAGGYTFKAKSSDKVKSNQLDSDLKNNFESAMNAGMTKASPKATLRWDL